MGQKVVRSLGNDVKLLRGFFIRLSESRRTQRFVLRNGVARRASRRFVAGETLDDALEAVRTLNRGGMHASLNYLGEKTTNPEEADGATREYVRMLDAITTHGLDCNLSVKLSQLGIAIAEDLTQANLRRVLDAARRQDIFVRIDMEESGLVEATLAIFRRLWSEGYRNVGVVLQAYLYRTPDDVEAVAAIGARIRLVKGAYLEPLSVAFPRKQEVDAQYRRLMEFLLRHATYPAVATHDEAMISHARDLVARESIGRDRFEFQMVYGVRRDLQAALAQEGYHMRVYVPFGEEWYPYFMRRLAERPANVFFVLRNLFAERRPRRQAA